MLTELRVRDFAIIESLDVEFSGGLNVLTGETGAGKSIIVDSIALLLGDKAEPGMVRAGAERALIEGVFTLAHAQPAHPERVEGREGAGVGNIAQLLTANGLENDDPATITLSREVRASGRTICRVNGRSVTQNILRELGELLVRPLARTSRESVIVAG
ncbi:MAG TPA: AAA family ATPase, partial [Thermoflexales bacterium]|nr:AAA family ATPase [Thermoflexales bacterium]